MSITVILIVALIAVFIATSVCFILSEVRKDEGGWFSIATMIGFFVMILIAFPLGIIYLRS